MAALHVAFGEERLVPAADDADELLGEVEFDHAVHGAGQELPVVADDDGGGAAR